MTRTAFEKGRIIIMGGGLQWRPLVHISDVSRAFLMTINEKITNVNREIFNVGLDNFQIKSLAYLVREELPLSVEIEVAPDDADKRDYNVVFEKIKTRLGFKAETQVQEGVREIYQALKNGKVDVGPKTVTVNWYKNILQAKALMDAVQLDGRVI
jgi:nucleoside-diphosphate-sugar epimerase